MTAFSSTVRAEVTPVPITLTHYDAETLTLHNALHRSRQPLTFGWHGRSASLYLMPEAAEVTADMTVAVCLGNEQLALSASWRTFDHLSEHPDRRRSMEDVDAELAAMWLEAVWLAWLEPLEATLGVDIRVQPAHPQGRPANPIHITLAFELDGEVHPLRVGLTTSTAKQLLPLFDRYFPTQLVMASGVMVMLNLTAGAQTLTLGEWRSLRPGDVVMLESFATSDDPNGATLNVGDRFSVGVSLSADGVCLKGPLTSLTSSQASNPPFENLMSEPPVDNPNLDDLPVRLTCEMGKLEMSLGELRALGEGSVLPMQRRPEQAVDLIVNGRCMGHGRLVMIGDGVGVQIERLALDEGHAGDE
ncbi:type III secretion system cytoplasmic ring protein SctQ [Vreelandella titanicae]|uniref:type III secretion system cytoplasmic ring protein SctQ n=1 Tax=Vreelandella titanicae TaxID=664683 RepID=UPI0039BFC6A9